MNFDTLIAESFGKTTIDSQNIRKFLKEMPSYMEWGIDQNVDKACLKTLNHADYFEFHLCRYLFGHPKTLHRVFKEVRLFQDRDGLAAHYFINYCMDKVKQAVVDNEWYELMPRLERAINRIKLMVPNPAELSASILLFKVSQHYPGHAHYRSK